MSRERRESDAPEIRSGRRDFRLAQSREISALEPARGGYLAVNSSRVSPVRRRYRAFASEIYERDPRGKSKRGNVEDRNARARAHTGRLRLLFTSACALNVERLSEVAKKETCIGAPGYIGFLFGFLDGWIGGGGVPPAKPLRSYQCGKSPLGSLGGSARFSRDSSVSLYSIPGQ